MFIMFFIYTFSEKLFVFLIAQIKSLIELEVCLTCSFPWQLDLFVLGGMLQNEGALFMLMTINKLNSVFGNPSVVRADGACWNSKGPIYKKTADSKIILDQPKVLWYGLLVFRLNTKNFYEALK